MGDGEMMATTSHLLCTLFPSQSSLAQFITTMSSSKIVQINGNSCVIPDLTLLEPFQAPSFVNTKTIRWMHELTPRFGNSNNLLLLMEGNEEEQRDYIKGLMASSIAIFCFFLVWMIFLLVFRCMGPYEVGILSGRPTPLPPQPAYNSGDLIAWKQRRSLAATRVNRLRMMICFCGIMIIASSCLMSVKGVSSLTQSIQDGTDSIALTENLANRAIKLIDRVAEQNSATAVAVDNLLEGINDICPLLRPEGLCLDLDDVSTCDFEGIFETDIIETTIRHFREADKSIYFQELLGARKDLEEFLVLTADLNDSAKSFNWALYSAMVFSLSLSVLCIFIIFCMACRTSRIVGCLQNCVLVPAFCVFVIISFGFSMTFVIGSMAVADLCYDSPDSNILVILNRFQQQLSPIAVDIASFYINECPPEAIPQDVSTQIEFVLDTIPTLGDFSSLVTESSSLIQMVCGFNETTQLGALGEAADEANGQLCDIVDVLNSIRLFFQCENWFPLYETTVYKAICYNGTEGFAWVASTQIAIVFFAALLLTFRAGFHNLTIEEGDDDKGDGTFDENESYGQTRSPKVLPSDGEEIEISLTPSGRNGRMLSYGG